MKRILITGEKSYIGEAVKRFIQQEPDKYIVDVIKTRGLIPIPEMFSSYDVVFNAAGVAHMKETKENRHLYYDVNRDLAIGIARAAKEAGVKQFILLSSMSVYGKTTGYIAKSDTPDPITAYGKSKLQADEAIRKLEDENFAFACLRPPMVYGNGCTGNYRKLRAFALKSPVFPQYDNKRSMLYIGNLCDFVKNVIDFERSGLFFPQNGEYANTSKMVQLIAEAHGKKIRLTPAFNRAIGLAPAGVVKKVFGELIYEPSDIADKYGFRESIILSEMEEETGNVKAETGIHTKT